MRERPIWRLPVRNLDHFFDKIDVRGILVGSHVPILLDFVLRTARRAATIIPSAELIDSALALHILEWHCANPIGPVDTAVTKMDKNENEILKLDQNDREIKSIAVKWGFSEIGSLCPRIPE